LEELEAMIGMRKCKDMVMMQVLYYLQRLHNFEEGDMMHTVLCGPPGCGKTTVGKLIGKIFSRLGLLSKKEKFVIATRGDLIGRFIGETTHKTMNLLNRCKGGVLFLDEAYNLANKGEDERSDSFGREALNLIMQFCSDHKRDFMCIIAGYEKEIEDNFFAINPGAARRFPWRIVIEPYNSEDLRAIFLRKINESEEWEIEEALLKSELFEDKELFSNSGGDIETLYFYCRLVHGINLIANRNKIKYLLTQEDIEGGFKMLRERKQNQNKKKLEAPIGMYS
jgi:SpoVK/Ycf46/Vps4 family AAA+-type ATPase